MHVTGTKKVYDKALEYYLALEAENKEDLNILFNIGLCLTEIKQYNKAINYFSSVDFSGTFRYCFKNITELWCLTVSNSHAFETFIRLSCRFVPFFLFENA